MVKKKKKKRQKYKAPAASNSPVAHRETKIRYNSNDQGEQYKRSATVAFYKSTTFYALIIAFFSLLAAILVPIYLTNRAEKKNISHLNHQLVVKPIAETKTPDGYSKWGVLLIVGNNGPASIKTSVTTMQFPQVKANLISPPKIDEKPVGGNIDIKTDMRNGWVEVAANERYKRKWLFS